MVIMLVNAGQAGSYMVETMVGSYVVQLVHILLKRLWTMRKQCMIIVLTDDQ